MVLLGSTSDIKATAIAAESPDTSKHGSAISHGSLKAAPLDDLIARLGQVGHCIEHFESIIGQN